MKNLQLLFGSQPQQTIFKTPWAPPMELVFIEDSTINSQIVEIYTRVSSPEKNIEPLKTSVKRINTTQVYIH